MGDLLDAMARHVNERPVGLRKMPWVDLKLMMH